MQEETEASFVGTEDFFRKNHSLKVLSTSSIAVLLSEQRNLSWPQKAPNHKHPQSLRFAIKMKQELKHSAASSSARHLPSARFTSTLRTCNASESFTRLTHQQCTHKAHLRVSRTYHYNCSCHLPISQPSQDLTSQKHRWLQSLFFFN